MTRAPLFAAQTTALAAADRLALRSPTFRLKSLVLYPMPATPRPLFVFAAMTPAVIVPWFVQSSVAPLEHVEPLKSARAATFPRRSGWPGSPSGAGNVLASSKTPESRSAT